MGQAALPLGQTLLKILKKYNNESYICFFINVGQIFLKGQLIQIFQKILETEIKHKLLMKINKESLRGQYG